MGDIVGRLFREFAVTLAVTILVSAIVSLTLTPMMCSKLLKHSPEAEQTRFYRVTERGWKAIISFYDRTLQVVLRHQTATLLVAAATLVLTILLYIYIPKGFFPIQDTGVIQGVSEAAQTVSFQEMSSEQQALGKIILKDPAVESLSSFIGIDGTNTTLNSGRILINLKPLDERKISASDVIRRLQPELARVPGITLYMQPVQDITVEDRVSRTQFQYTLEDPNADELDTFAPRMLEKLQEVARTARCGERPAGGRAARQAGLRPQHRLPPRHHALHHRSNALRRLRPAGSVHDLHAVEPVPRGAGSEAGLSAESPGPARPLHSHQRGDQRHRFGRIGVGRIGGHPVVWAHQFADRCHHQPVEFHLVSGLSSTIASDNAFGGGQIASTSQFPNGGQVPLAAFTHVEEMNAPITVNHQGQFPVVTLSFNLAPGASLGDAVTAVNKVKDESQHAGQHSGGISGYGGVLPGLALQ